MKKRLRFISTMGVFLIVFLVISLILPVINVAQAGTLTEVRIDLSNNAPSTSSVDLEVLFKTPTALVITDKIVISFRDGSGFDVTTEGDVSGSTTVLADASDPPTTSITVTTSVGTEGGGSADDYTIVLGAGIAQDDYVKVTITGDLNTPSAGTYIVDVSTTDTSDVEIDSVAAAVVIGTNQVTISGSVDPTLTLEVLQTGESSGGTSATTCALGTLTTTTIQTCGYDIRMATNADGGYTTYIRDGGDLTHTNASDTIADEGGDDVLTIGTEEYGVNTTQAGQTITRIDDDDSSSTYLAADCSANDGDTAGTMPATDLTTSDQAFASATAPVSASSELISVCHGATISGTTVAGSYSHTVTITAVGSF